MSEHTWTDKELSDACALERMSLFDDDAFRAVLVRLGAVHPVEARERERKAAHAASNQRWLGTFDDFCRWVDESYPSLLLQSPPPLVLTCGEFRKEDGVFRRIPSALGISMRLTAEMMTPADARALAEWLEKYGTEEERK